MYLTRQSISGCICEIMTLFASRKHSPVRKPDASTSSFSKLAHRLVVNTVREQEVVAQQPDAPPLNLITTTPWNVTKIVVRLGPVVDVYQHIESVIMWRDALKSTCWMVAWVALCRFIRRCPYMLFALLTHELLHPGYHPTLLCITPHLCLIVFVLRNYHKKQAELNQSAPAETSWSTSIAIGSEQYFKNIQVGETGLLKTSACTFHSYQTKCSSCRMS